MKESLPILSKHNPFGTLVVVVVVLKMVFSPLKHTEALVDGSPVMEQKVELDGQISVNLVVVLAAGGAWPCNNGEFSMEIKRLQSADHICRYL
ncbi:hypothetical protein HanHA89_Chr02g0055261 [Helianthus annuus]|nr:hypothetical protein HanHA89_Chr02g0055261 [Helianthus annuus]